MEGNEREEKWDKYNSIINKTCFKKIRAPAGVAQWIEHQLTDPGLNTSVQKCKIFF